MPRPSALCVGLIADLLFGGLRPSDGLRSPSARCASPASWSSLAFSSLRGTCFMVFAHLQLAARDLLHGLRSPSARCARLASWSSLAFSSLRETCFMVFARLQLAARDLLHGLRSPSARCARLAADPRYRGRPATAESPAVAAGGVGPATPR